MRELRGSETDVVALYIQRRWLMTDFLSRSSFYPACATTRANMTLEGV